VFWRETVFPGTGAENSDDGAKISKKFETVVLPQTSNYLLFYSYKMVEQKRIWCFTLQARDDQVESWTNSEAGVLTNPDESLVQAGYYQIEKAPTTGKIHAQGFLVLKKRVVFNRVKQLYPEAHWEPAKGSQGQNIAYCSKSESRVKGPFQFGELEKQGKSKPLQSAIKLIKEGNGLKKIWEEYPEVMVHHARGLSACLCLQIGESPPWRSVEVHWYWGKTGVGKTRRAFDDDPLLYQVVGKGKWWDGYLGQSAILFDEFYGEIQMKDMLRWLDGYKCQVPIKGGFVWAHWTKVYITSNTDPKYMYPTVPEQVREAFFRRIATIECMGEVPPPQVGPVDYRIGYPPPKPMELDLESARSLYPRVFN